VPGGLASRTSIEGGDALVSVGGACEYHSTDQGEVPMPLRGWRTEEWRYVEQAPPDDNVRQGLRKEQGHD
jgi:hypothetical protein